MATYNNAIDPRPKKASQNLVTSGGVFDNMGALDVSELNATENPHTLAKYVDLSAALAAIPTDYQKGGMSIKFVQSSDNNYVQFRLMAQSFTTDTTQWAICDDSVLVECPEYVAVYTDADGKIIIAVENDGNVYYGAGVPKQVIDYITAKIAELSLDEYEDIVTFLGTLINGDKTLAELLNEKVDKVDGKSLIDEDVAAGESYVENPEFLDVETDSEGKILEGHENDGTKFFDTDVKFKGKATFQKDVEVQGDFEVQGITTFGKEYLEIPKISIDGVESETIDDPEGRLDISLDSEKKVVSFHDNEGVLHEEAGIETSSVKISKNEGINQLTSQLEEGIETVTPTLVFVPGYAMHSTVIISTSTGYSISKPFKVWKGDTVEFTAKAASNVVILAFTHDELGNVINPIYLGNGEVSHYSYTFQESGYMRISCVNLDNLLPVVKIKRNGLKEYICQTILEEKNTVQKEYYFDKADFSPEKYNSILCYRGDDKVNTSNIVNAVSYPDGTIIACRDNGTVVKIDKNDNETTMLTVSAGWDWRGCFIDSNNNVYVSPHKSAGSGTLLADRGLYRLGYNENSFTKVVSLYHSEAECGVMIYPVPWGFTSDYDFISGNLYYNGILYRCTESYTGRSINTSKCEVVEIDDWSSSHSYSKGDFVEYDNNSWVCNTAHTSSSTFDSTKWYPLTTCMQNDDTFWTMCEDRHGYLYAGVYSHTKRPNPTIYCSKDGGNTWYIACNTLHEGYAKHLPMDEGEPMHIHCVFYNEYNDTLCALIGEINDMFVSNDFGESWSRANVRHEDYKDTVGIAVPDGIILGNDHYHEGIITKFYADGRIKTVGKLWHAEFFGLRKSDVTGWIYAFSKIETSINNNITAFPPYAAINDQAVLNEWLSQRTEGEIRRWEMYKDYVEAHYDHDYIHPINAVIMVSKDNGESWEVIYKFDTSEGGEHRSGPGIFCVGYFRNGECLCGITKGGADGLHFVNPVIISESKHKYTDDGLDLSGEIFIKTNNSSIINY
jgi:hypothetical protein